MASYSVVKGEIYISPPIEQSKLDEAWEFKTIRFESSTGDGENTADLILPWFEDEYRADDLEDDLLRVVELFGQTHTIVGYLEEQHEDRDVNHGMWRFYVRGNKVTKVVPAIVWNEPLIAV